jgi:hypothetical protein
MPRLPFHTRIRGNFSHLPWMQWGSLPPWEQKKILQFRGNVCALATRSVLEVPRLSTTPQSSGYTSGLRLIPKDLTLSTRGAIMSRWNSVLS